MMKSLAVVSSNLDKRCKNYEGLKNWNKSALFLFKTKSLPRGGFLLVWMCSLPGLNSERSQDKETRFGK